MVRYSNAESCVEPEGDQVEDRASQSGSEAKLEEEEGGKQKKESPGRQRKSRNKSPKANS